MLGAQILGGLLQDKPDVPAFKAIDAAGVQKDTIAGNLEALPEATKLSAGVVDSWQQMLAKAIPQYDQLTKQISGNLSSWMKGEVPQDVAQAIGRSSVAKSLAGGFGPASGIGRNLVARDLGITSLNLMEKATDSAQRWIAQGASSMPALADVSTMMFSPQQRLAHAVSERDKQMSAQWLKNQIDAQFSTGTIVGQGIMTEDAQVTQIISSLAGSAGGAMMCWVARECYGDKDDTWKVFRHWLLRFAPKWFMNLYRKYGERFAAWISNKPRIKALIRRWMDKRIAWVLQHYSQRQTVIG